MATFRFCQVHSICFALFFFASELLADSPIEIPAATCYGIPNEDGLRISSKGVTQWTNSNTGIRWCGQLKHRGLITATVVVRAIENGKIQLSMAIDDEVQEASADATIGETVRLVFAPALIEQAGYHAFTVRSVNAEPKCEVIALELEGASAKGAHFNLKPRRNAASVHLAYPVHQACSHGEGSGREVHKEPSPCQMIPTFPRFIAR